MNRRDAELTDTQVNQETGEVHVTLTTEPLVVQQQSSFVSSDLMSKFINPYPDISIDSIPNPNVVVSVTPSSDTTIPQPPILIIQPQQQTHNSTTTTTIIPTTTLPEIPNFASLFDFDRMVSSLEIELSELKQTNQFAEVVASIPGIVDNYLTSKMKDEVNDKLREEAQAENQDFLNSLDSNMKRIIKESDVQKNLYRALLKAYNSDKDLLSSYGSKQQRSGKEESSKESTQKKSKSTSSSKGTTRSPPKSSGKSVQDEEHDLRVDDLEELFHQEFDTGNDDVSPVREATYVDERLPYPRDLSKLLPLIPDARGRQIIPYDHFLNNDLEYLKGGSSSRKYTTSIPKTKAPNYGHVKWIKYNIPKSTWSEVQVVYDKHAYWGTYHWGPKHQRFYGYATNMETLKDVYSKHKIIVVISLKIMEFFGYTHLEEITGKLTNLNVDERFILNVALRMYTRRIVIQERVEDLQLAVKSYQKKINLTKPDTYHSDISKKTPYTAYHDIQGIIYQDDMDINRLMGTDELHKFNDGTLNHVRTSLNDIATRIQMEYFLKRKLSKQDKQRSRMIIKAIDKKIKDMRYKVVRHRYSNPVIQPELEESTQGYLLVSVEVLRYDKRSKSEIKGRMQTEMELTLEQTQQGVSYEVSVSIEGVEE
ncbi:hypothetical protein Tco_0952417 [Tanacetum coccineum]|uniref:Uncharacterized protein n=1 Tax=Tanacetum coccineum TaxID=301880 RepID=A0ABQ5DXP1_9ASTR